MKVREAIEQLSELDPEAEMVSENNDPLYNFSQLSGYYDGRYATLKTDPAREPYYSIVGMTMGRGDGLKVKCCFKSYIQVLENDPEADVSYADGEVPDYVEEVRQEVIAGDLRSMTRPLDPVSDTETSRCRNRLFIQYCSAEEYQKFFDKFKATAAEWRKKDSRCYQFWYPRNFAFRYYDLDTDMLDAAKRCAFGVDYEPDRFQFDKAPLRTSTK